MRQIAPAHGPEKFFKAFVEKKRSKALADFLRQLILYSSRPHATESRIHVLVVRLKPVAKTRSQHARSRSRRAAFKHEMLVVVKVRGVAQVERKRLKTGQRPEGRRRPFPAVAKLPNHARRAAILRVGLDR